MSADVTPYGDINAVLGRLLAGQRAVLGERLVGLYLFGSLAAGDFDHGSSDIDLVAATVGELDERTMAALGVMHQEVAAGAGEWGRRMEIAYISTSAPRRYDAGYRQPAFSSGPPLRMTAPGADWVINRRTLREMGVTLSGPPPASLIEPVSRGDLVAAVRQSCAEWRAYLDVRRDTLRPRPYQGFAILTLCRALYTLERGETVSKMRAARWAERALPEWAPLIRAALGWRRDWREPADPDATLPETLRFLRDALGRCAGGESRGMAPEGGVM